MHPVRVRSLFFFGLCALSLSAPARAESPRHTFRLVYVRGPGAAACPDEATLRKDLAGIMHYDPVQPDAPRRVTAIIERRGAELTAIALMRDEEGHVLWETDTVRTTSPCRVLVDALALAIDAWLGEPKGPPAPPPEPPKVQPPVPSAVAPPATSAPLPPSTPAPGVPVLPTPPAPRNVTGYAGLDALGSFGVTPTPSLGAGFYVGARLREPAVFVEAGARVTSTVVATNEANPDGTILPVRSTFFAATLAGCGFVNRWLFFCPIIGVGTLNFSFPARRPVTSTHAGFGLVGARVGVERVLAEHVGLRVVAELEALPGSAELQILDVQVWTKPPVMGSVGVGFTFGPW